MACAGAVDELMRGSGGLFSPGCFQKNEWIGFYDLKENLRGILLMLLAMARFAIEDGVIKNLTNTLPVSEILILTGTLGALVLPFSQRYVKRSCIQKTCWAKSSCFVFLPTCLRHYFLCLSWHLFLYQWPPQSCSLFLYLRRLGLRSGWVKVLVGAVGAPFVLDFLGCLL